MSLILKFIFILTLTLPAWSELMPFLHGQSLAPKIAELYFGQNIKISIPLNSWKLKSKTSMAAEFQKSIASGDLLRAEVREFKLEKKMNFKTYVHQWIRDYEKFNFTKLTHQPVKINQMTAYLVDLKHNTIDSYQRQAIFKKKKNIVLITCQSKKKSQKALLVNCNQLIRSFSWNLD